MMNSSNWDYWMWGSFLTYMLYTPLNWDLLYELFPKNTRERIGKYTLVFKEVTFWVTNLFWLQLSIAKNNPGLTKGVIICCGIRICAWLDKVNMRKMLFRVSEITHHAHCSSELALKSNDDPSTIESTLKRIYSDAERNMFQIESEPNYLSKMSHAIFVITLLILIFW